MSAQVLTNALIALDDLNVSGDSNRVALSYGADQKEFGVFGDTAKRRRAGLFACGLSAESFWESTPDSNLFTAVGTDGKVITACPDTAVGTTSFSFKATMGSYEPINASHGDPHKTSLQAASSTDLVRGILVHNGSESASGTTSAYSLGAASSTQKLYAALHVFSVSGGTPSLDMLIESDSASGFTSAVTQITFPNITSAGGYWQELSGAIADTYFRGNFTITGTFDFVLTIGIK